MDVELLLQQLGQVFPHHPQNILRNCINERLLLLPEDAEVGSVMDSCINWLLDHQLNETDEVILRGVIDADRPLERGRDEVEVVRETE